MTTDSAVKHTPGPWHLLGSSDNGQVSVEFSNIDEVGNRHAGHIATVDGMRGERQRANARLIAAAPELADLVLRMYCTISHGGPTRAEATVVLMKAGLL